jgi:hypothetical protein
MYDYPYHLSLPSCTIRIFCRFYEDKYKHPGNCRIEKRYFDNQPTMIITRSISVIRYGEVRIYLLKSLTKVPINTFTICYVLRLYNEVCTVSIKLEFMEVLQVLEIRHHCLSHEVSPPQNGKMGGVEQSSTLYSTTLWILLTKVLKKFGARGIRTFISVEQSSASKRNKKSFKKKITRKKTCKLSILVYCFFLFYPGTLNYTEINKIYYFLLVAKNSSVNSAIASFRSV